MSQQYYPFDPYTVGDPNLTIPYYDSTQLMNDSRVLGPQGYADAVAFWYRPDPASSMFERQGAAQIRPGPPNASEHVKHRRTRSGCYTCRSRRVKCDESRPICARCKKGNRDCVYPDASSTSKGSSRQRANEQRTAGQDSQSPETDDAGESRILETIKDEDDEEAEDEEPNADLTGRQTLSPTIEGTSVTKKESSQSLNRADETRQQSESSSSVGLTPSTEASATFSGAQTPASSIRTVPSTSTIRSSSHVPHPKQWSHLKPDVQELLQYHQNNISYFHYFFKTDATDFLHTGFIELALGHEPLLYALVGFAAYHRTVAKPNGKLSEFLGYYSQSLSSLRKEIESSNSKKISEARILTICTLATFEEYLGDWIHLRGHHRAAVQMIHDQFTPQTMVETETRRVIFNWCARLDVIVGLLAANKTTLGREWYLAFDLASEQLAATDSLNAERQISSINATNRLIGYDMAGLLSSLPRGKITMDDFMVQYKEIGERIDQLRLQIQLLNDGTYAVNEFPNKKALGLEDIVDPYVPGGLFSGPLYALNFTWIDWFAIKLMYRYQLSTITGEAPPAELAALAFEQCRIFESIARWPEALPGSTVGLHASLGIAAVFLQKDDRHTMWCRQRLALLEQQGYVYPPTFRTRMAEMWHLPEVTQWWLPNGEGFHPILQAIRAFTEERASQPVDDRAQDLKDMKAIFSKLNISDSPQDSPQSATGGAGSGATGGTASRVGTNSPSTVSFSPRSQGSDEPVPSNAASDSATQYDMGSGQSPGSRSGGKRREDRMSGIWEGNFAP